MKTEKQMSQFPANGQTDAWLDSFTINSHKPSYGDVNINKPLTAPGK